MTFLNDYNIHIRSFINDKKSNWLMVGWDKGKTFTGRTMEIPRYNFTCVLIFWASSEVSYENLHFQAFVAFPGNIGKCEGTALFSSVENS